MSKEAMKLALEALGWTDEWRPDGLKEQAITALREALAEQPAQQALDKMAENAREIGLDYEPVWGGGPTNKDYEDAMRQRRLHQLTTPPDAFEQLMREADKPTQVSEGIAKYAAALVAGTHEITSVTIRPKRTWVGLTDDEKRQLFEREDYQGWLDYINAIEAKLKERNT